MESVHVVYNHIARLVTGRNYYPSWYEQHIGHIFCWCSKPIWLSSYSVVALALGWAVVEGSIPRFVILIFSHHFGRSLLLQWDSTPLMVASKPAIRPQSGSRAAVGV